MKSKYREVLIRKYPAVNEQGFIYWIAEYRRILN